MGTNSIDLTYLKNISNGNQLFELKLLRTFVEQTSIEIKNMEQSDQQNNWDVLGAIAHKIKPSFHFVGALKTQALLNTIEASARSKTNLAKLPGLVRRFLLSGKQIIAAIKIEIERIEGAVQ